MKWPKHYSVRCKKCKKWNPVLLCECCEMICKDCWEKHAEKCDEYQKEQEE